MNDFAEQDWDTVRRASVAAALCKTVAGGFAILGSFGPWITVSSGLGSAALAGIDRGGDGVYTLIGGVCVLISGLINIVMQRPYRVWSCLVSLLVPALLFAVMAFDFKNIQDKVTANDSASFGWGYYTIGIAATLATVGFLMAIFSRNLAAYHRARYGTSN